MQASNSTPNSNLSGARLTDADLSGTNLDGIIGANFTWC
ncbi:MAG: pentapeptide repeat-containing protein [Dehalococcoidia bacterium]|nr:pentapeptide repeat-containing protein [Dehalococcoidia bacterium]